MKANVSFLRRRYTQIHTKLTKLLAQIHEPPGIIQGSVVAIDPPFGSPRAKTRFIHTTKVHQKTVTTSISEGQFKIFKKMIELNRKVKEELEELREVSKELVLTEVVGVAKREKK